MARVLSSNPVTRVPINAVAHDRDGAEAALAAARAAIARGIRTIKLKTGADHDRTLATLRELRGALPDITLRVDANQSWPLAEVESRMRDLVSLRLQYVEEPAAGLATALDGPLPIPVALDESLASPDCNAWLHHALHSGALAALVLKPTVLGGILICQHLAEHARAHGIEVNITHALEGPVAMAACASFALALAPEHAVGLDRHAFLDAWPMSPPQLAADAIVATNAPGLGLDLDALLAAAENDERPESSDAPDADAASVAERVP
jgi:L-alanine-DL-glutamate epimerase-like enolase superfamily enzyme